jgi:small-conductance mechanosensitive channel
VLVSSALIVALLALGLATTRVVSQRALQTIQSMPHLRQARRQQLLTLTQILRWGTDIVMVGAALLTLLSTFGIDVTPMLASVGVAGLAISLGAQTLIKDLIGGVLILVENQYVVGDVIQVGAISGDVERLTLRATYVRDAEGRLHIVPNGEVRVVSNVTKEWSRAVVDVGVAYEEDVARALQVLEKAAGAFAQEPAFGPQLLESPQTVGPVSLGDWAWTARVMVKTQPGKQWRVAQALRRHILAACEREGVTLPYPRQEVWVRENLKGLEEAICPTLKNVS